MRLLTTQAVRWQPVRTHCRPTSQPRGRRRLIRRFFSHRKRVATAALFLVAAVAALPATSLAQIFVESVEPPSLKRGGVTRITLRGSHLEDPVGLWTSIPRGVVSAHLDGATNSPKEATFDVELAPDTEIGFYGIRLATKSGLSNVHLFLVDDLPTIPEEEAQSRTRVALPAAIAGVCRERDVDRFTIDVQAGQRVTFEAVGNRLGKDFDPLVVVRNARGRRVVSRDNDAGLFFDCRFDHLFTKAGTYTVEIRDSRFHGSDYWSYVLRVGNFPAARVALPSSVRPGERASLSFPQASGALVSFDVPYDLTRLRTRQFYYALKRDGDSASTWVPLVTSDLPSTLESEPNDTPEEATAATVPGILHGLLKNNGDRDAFALDLVKDQRLTIQAVSRRAGSPADLQLKLFDATGKKVTDIDDSGVDEASFEFKASADGRHTLVVSDLHGEGGMEFVYRVEIEQKLPGISLRSDVARLAIPQGTYQPLPLHLSRSEFKGSVTLKLEGAPPGMALRDTTIVAETSALRTAISVDKSVPLGIYTLQVVATARDGEREIETLARTQPLVDRVPTGQGPHGEPYVLREDQLHLPPTLTDRFAVVVTQPTPYDFGISTEVVELPRFLHTTFEIETTRTGGFEKPISFIARGGELEKERLNPARVVPTIPLGTTAESTTTVTLHSTVQSRFTRHPVTLTATTKHDGRTISLTRMFDLAIVPAFEPAIEPLQIELRAGESATVLLRGRRRSPFEGEISVQPGRVEGLSIPEMVTIPAGHEAVKIDIAAAPGVKPGSYEISLPGTAVVRKFAEQSGGKNFKVVVKE